MIDPQESVSILHHINARIEWLETLIETRFEASHLTITAVITAQKLATDAALISAERAVAKAEIATEKRFESVNEFRGQLDDQAKTFIPRAEVQAIIDAIRINLQHIEDSLNKEMLLARSSESTLANTLLPRIEAKATFDSAVTERGAMLNRINVLEQANANMQGRIWAMGVGITIMTVVVSTIIHFIH